jgi:hypothetical protein
MHTEVFVQSFSLFLLGLIKIDNVPFLIGFTMFAPNNNSLSFSISATCNIKNLVVLNVDEHVAFILEDLPPSRVSAPDLHVSSFS